MSVVVFSVRLSPGADAADLAEHYADLIRESGGDTNEVAMVSYEIKPDVADQWCPVCKTFHREVGETTDAGRITRACPLLPTTDPRYYGSPIYTGDR